jgi:hypothetical protein
MPKWLYPVLICAAVILLFAAARWQFYKALWIAGVLGQLATPFVIGVLSIIIAARQAETHRQNLKTNQYNVKIALFDRRMKIYEAIGKLVSELSYGEKLTTKMRNDFQDGTAHAVFLFPPGAMEQIKNLQLHCNMFGSVKDRLDRAEHINNLAEQESLNNQYDKLNDDMIAKSE